MKGVPVETQAAYVLSDKPPNELSWGRGPREEVLGRRLGIRGWQHQSHDQNLTFQISEYDSMRRSMALATPKTIP